MPAMKSLIATLLSRQAPRMYESALGRHPQQGSALIMSLVFLLILTLLVITASSSSMLQFRMAGNLRNAQQAEISANNGLRGAEWMLWTVAKQAGGHLLCTDGELSSHGCIMFNERSDAYDDGGVVREFQSEAGWLSTGIEYKGSGGFDYTDDSLDTAQLAQNPRYIVEDLGRVRPPGAGPAVESGSAGGMLGNSVNMNSYRITARATGGSEKSIRVMQSTFDAQTMN